MATNLVQSSTCLSQQPCFTAATRVAARRISLARHQVFTIRLADGIRSVKVLRGTIWLTATPGDRDVLFSAGDYFILGPNAPFVLEALADAEIVLHP